MFKEMFTIVKHPLGISVIVLGLLFDMLTEPSAWDVFLYFCPFFTGCVFYIHHDDTKSLTTVTSNVIIGIALILGIIEIVGIVYGVVGTLTSNMTNQIQLTNLTVQVMLTTVLAHFMSVIVIPYCTAVSMKRIL